MAEILVNPNRSSFEIVRSPADPKRDPSEIVLTLPPGGLAPPPHVHPRQRETFTLEEGDFELLLDGDWHKLAPGETVTVEAGRTHAFRNRGTRTARVRDVHEPGLSFESYVREVHATTARSGSARVTPALAARMAVIWRRHADTIRPGPLPLRLAFAALSRIAPVLGLRPAPVESRPSP